MRLLFTFFFFFRCDSITIVNIQFVNDSVRVIATANLAPMAADVPISIIPFKIPVNTACWPGPLRQNYRFLNKN